jgi:hypothetical protein
MFHRFPLKEVENNLQCALSYAIGNKATHNNCQFNPTKCLYVSISLKQVKDLFQLHFLELLAQTHNFDVLCCQLNMMSIVVLISFPMVAELLLSAIILTLHGVKL